jgi:origin recognition complex subunit 5
MKDFLETYQGQLPPWATNFTSFEEFQNCFMGLSDIIVSSLYDITLNIYDMIHVARRLFPKYIEPVVSGRQPANSKHLMDAVQSDLRYGLVSIMKREPSGKLWKMGETEKLTTAQKYLLIAAFIASYNDAKHDAKFFGNVTTSRKKGKGRVGKGPRMNTFQLGPKAFAADRALAIFFHILEEPLEPSIDIYIQFVSLISKGYLTRINGAALHKNFTAGLKCKCNTKYNYVKSIADSVDFKLDNYLILS